MTSRESTPGFEEPGTRIDRYRLQEVLGEGGFGIVYRAEQLEPVQREVALKVVKVGMDTRDLLARFDAERQALAVMEHPGIAVVLDAGATANGRPYFVMELVRGPRITDWCDDHGSSVNDRLALFRGVCDAVQHAHQKGVLHRDLKPSNVLVADEDGKPWPKVIDFGLAKATQGSVSDQTMLTEAGQVMGTPIYMSPEQAAGRIDAIDTRSDVYSLGVLLYEMLTGCLPFSWQRLKDMDFFEAQRILVEEDPPRPSTRITKSGEEASTAAAQRGLECGTLVRRLRGDLDWIVMKALEKDPSRRYGSAHELALDIDRHLRHEPVSAGPPGAAYQLRKLVRRHRVAVAAASLVLLAVIAGGVGTTVALLREQDANQKLSEALGTVQSQSDELEARALELAEERDRAREAEKQAADERDRAQENLAMLRETHSFLNDDLLSAVGADFQGSDVTVRQALDRASSLAGIRFLGRPRLEAQIRSTLARSYQQLGLHEKAGAEAQRNEELWRQLGGGDPEAGGTLQARSIQAQTLISLGKYDEAETLLAELIEEAEETTAEDSKPVLTLRSDYGLVRERQGHRDEAETIYRELLALHDRDGGRDRGYYATLNNLGRLLLQKGRYREALGHLEEVMDAGARALGRQNDLFLSAQSSVVRALHIMGRVEEAESMALEQLELRRKVSGADHPDTAMAMSSLAQLRAERGFVAEAAEMYEESYEILRDSLGEDHPDTLMQAGNLSVSWGQLQQLDRALQLREEVLETQRRKRGPEHPDTLVSMNNLAGLYRDLARYDESVALYEETLEIERRVLGEDHPSTLITLENLGGVHYARGRYGASLEIVEQVLERRRATLGDDHPAVAKTLYNLAQHHRVLGRSKIARELYEEVVQRFMRLYGRVHPTRAEALRQLADMDWDDGDLEMAEERYWEVHDIHADISPADDPMQSFLRHQLGALAVQQDRYDEGEELLAEAVALRRGESDRRLLYTSLFAYADAVRKNRGDVEAVAPLLESAEGFRSLGAEEQRPADALVRLYERLHEEQPDAGWDGKAAEWRERVR